MERWRIAVEYHERTKHHFNRYARSLGYLDWATQPDPFRRYHGAPLVPLRFSENEPAPSYDDLFVPGTVKCQPVTLATVSEFFEFSLALSAWKQYRGSRWALRINPSSGNLHPTEGYVVTGRVDGLGDWPGVYHYTPKEHALERRAEIATKSWDALMEGLPKGSFLAGLTSIHWREAWKYGERAYRYCRHDAGHALAALTVSAAVQGWNVYLLPTWSDADIAALLGLDRADDFADTEREQPDLLAAVIPAQPEPRVSARAELNRSRDQSDSGHSMHRGTPSPYPQTLPDPPYSVGSSDPRSARPTPQGGRVVSGCTFAGGLESNPKALADIAHGPWLGRANRLSKDHVTWELIDAVADACSKPTTPPPMLQAVDAFGPPLASDRRPFAARTIIRQRRSAVAFDGVTSIHAEQFYLMLDRVLPRPQHLPWKTFGPPAHVHLGLFVHRVEGLACGLYFLVRDPVRLTELRTAMDPTFLWSKPRGCPESMPLYLLAAGDARYVAGQLCCGQDIAADSAFSLGMIAEFERPLKEHGAWFYRRLFWETGVIGQILYLEAEGAGVRATGIGCFFDDPVHELFGLRGKAYQSLYHFTIGGHVEDARLTTLPPYPDVMSRGL